MVSADNSMLGNEPESFAQGEFEESTEVQPETEFYPDETNLEEYADSEEVDDAQFEFHAGALALNVRSN